MEGENTFYIFFLVIWHFLIGHDRKGVVYFRAQPQQGEMYFSTDGNIRYV
jgi:hypothetical protein